MAVAETIAQKVKQEMMRKLPEWVYWLIGLLGVFAVVLVLIYYFMKRKVEGE